MKLEEAIAEQDHFNSATFETRFVTFNEALQLGIEAMKHIQRERKAGLYDFDDLLPGETKE